MSISTNTEEWLRKESPDASSLSEALDSLSADKKREIADLLLLRIDGVIDALMACPLPLNKEEYPDRPIDQRNYPTPT